MSQTKHRFKLCSVGSQNLIYSWYTPRYLFSKARKLVGRHTFKDFKQSGRQRRERSRSKMTLYSWSEFRNSWMCSTSLVAKHLSFSITYVSSARNLKNLLLRSLFSDHANFGDFTLLFCRARLRNVHTFKTHVLSYWSLR